MNTRSKNLPADERRAVTVEAVVALAASKNPSEITTAAIAKQMNLTQGALFRHFPNKEAIWQAVMEWVAERLLARIDRAAQDIESPLAALQAMFLSHVEFVAEHPGVPRMLFGELQRTETTPAKRMVQKLLQRYGERLNQLIELGKARGELSVTLDNEAAAMLFIGSIQGLVMQSLLAGDVDRIRRDAPRVFEIYRCGIGERAMKRLPLQGRTLALLAVVVPLLALFVHVALRSGPLAPVKVTVATVETKSITPALFGIGTVEARYTYKIGPTFTGRVKRLDVQVGERVKSGQLLGEMEPVDLDERIRSQEAAFKRANAALSEAEARHAYAETQLRRFEKLFEVRSTSEESVTTKRQELQIADAGLSAAREELSRVRFDREALEAQRANLKLVAPVDGLVAQRNADPGTTVVAGQPVVEIIDPRSLWINTRFDQISAAGLAAEQSARIVLRSRSGQQLAGRVLRVEPMADAVTEELLAKVAFETQPELLPPIGELAEVTVDLPALPAAPVIPNAAIRRVGDNMGVWQIVNGGLQFTPVQLGASDPDGRMQVQEGLNSGDRFVVYSEKALTAGLRVHVVEQLPGVSR